ncbi:MAG: hypothetical protein LBD21_10375 [Tannerellaceae bacterium]|jgi:hypothetical protein|nr:hypothetical protein [Tannerellaceae bacterium]
MKKITYLLLLLAFVGQLALAQRTRPIVVQFSNGNVLRGEVFRLPDNRLRIYAGNGIIVNFAPGDVRSMTYADDNSRVTNIPPLPQQGQQNNQAQQRPPSNQQNRQGTQQPNQRQGQQNQQNRQGQQPNQRQGNQQGNQQNRQSNQQSQNNRQNNQQQPRTAQNNQAGDDFFFEDEGLDMLLSPTPPNNKKQDTKKQDSKTQSSSTSTTGNRQATSTAGNRQAAAATGAAPTDEPFSIRPRIIIEGGYTVGMGNEFSSVSRMEGSLSFGAQITRDLFIGIGAGINMFGDKVYFVYDSAKVSSAVDTLDNMNMSLPLYLDIRYNIPVGNGSIVPFVGIKGGMGLGFITRKFLKEENTIRTETKPESLGMYISPSVGAKYMLTNSLALSMSLGYTMQMRKYVYNAKTATPMNRSEGMGGFTIRVGLEF